MTHVEKIYALLAGYIVESGIPFSRWYVGVASRPRERLFKDHNVSEKWDRWVYKNAGSEKTAREVVKRLIELRGSRGGTGTGNEFVTYVYAYAITKDTVQ